MFRWFRAFLPREERFFDLFARHAEVCVKGAEALQGVLRGGEETAVFCQRVNQFENDADNITREVLTAVRRTFITPFDRGDIKNLITSMDDAIDQMNKTANVITLFEVRSFEPQMEQMGEIGFQASKLVLEAMPLLRSIGKNAGRLNALTEQIIRIEERSDQLHDEGRKALFLANREANAGNTMSFTIGTEIYDHLEKVVDRLEDVANEINALVVDHL